MQVYYVIKGLLTDEMDKLFVSETFTDSLIHSAKYSGGLYVVAFIPQVLLIWGLIGIPLGTVLTWTAIYSVVWTAILSVALAFVYGGSLRR